MRLASRFARRAHNTGARTAPWSIPTKITVLTRSRIAVSSTPDQGNGERGRARLVLEGNGVDVDRNVSRAGGPDRDADVSAGDGEVGGNGNHDAVPLPRNDLVELVAIAGPAIILGRAVLRKDLDVAPIARVGDVDEEGHVLA